MKTTVIIPASDEEAIIAETVGRVRALRSPLGQVYVIADRCQDATAEAARNAGARVFERRGGLPGKGPALAWFLTVAADDLANTEAAVILDADSRPDDSLAVLIRALQEGADAAQAFVYPVLEKAAPTVQLAAYSEWLSQAMDDRLRRRLGWPVPLRGTGMAVRLPLLREIGPFLRTRVEDVELTLLLALRGARIVFVPEAVVRDPKPRGLESLARQRARWLKGSWEIWRIYGRAVLRLLATGGPGTWWLLSAVLLKPKAFVIAAKVGAFVVLWGLSARRLFHVLWIVIGLSLLANVLYYLVGLAFVPRSWRSPTVRALLYTPSYLIIWVRALIWSLTSRLSWLRARD